MLAAVSAEQLSTRVVFLVETVDDLELRIAVARGAYGLIFKEAAPDILLYSVRQVASGHRLLLALLDRESGRTRERAGRATTEDGLLTALTHRELQIMQLVSEGLSNKEVGRQLNVSDGTIKVHLHHIYQKLAISNRTALASLVVSRHGATPSAN